jgi:hypothetical protein
LPLKQNVAGSIPAAASLEIVMCDKINTIDKNQLCEIINKSEYLSEVMRTIGVDNHGGNYRKLIRRLEKDGTSNIIKKFRKNFGSGKHKIKSIEQLSEVLTANSKVKRGYIKKELIKHNILKEVCYVCGQLPMWCDKKLVLVLDHINGICNDYRIENLRLLCPNCNSQTDTFAGKNRKYKKIDTKVFTNKDRTYTRKIADRPTLETLKADVKELGYRGTGRKYKVTDNTIRKWLRWHVNAIRRESYTDIV